MPDSPRQLVLLYHFFHPDDVISARLYSELAVAAAARGWQVIAVPSVRSCHDGSVRLPRRETWQQVRIERVWRPGLRQASNLGRLLNTFFMLSGWKWKAMLLGRVKHEVVIIGTDPILGALASLPWRLLRPRSRLVHWCHDVHPEASLADGALRASSWSVRGLRWLLRRAYRRYDVVADLGSCMRKLLASAGGWSETDPTPIVTTLTPWSLVEPSAPVERDAHVRRELFGNASIGLLYSGNLGRAHDYQLFLRLARRLRDAHESIRFCFAGRGVGLDAMRQELTTEDTNIRVAGFADESALEKRLGAGDIHLVSLKEKWTGTVVPSKFFGALAIGRPVLFVGSNQSAIAAWLREHGVGWTLSDSNLDDVVSNLQRLASQTSELSELEQRCWQVYQQHFSRRVQLDRWLETLDHLAE